MRTCCRIEVKNKMLTTLLPKKIKSILIPALLITMLLLIATGKIFSAVPIVFNSTENYPKVEVKFMLIDATNRVVPNLSANDIGINFKDNDIPLNLISFNSSVAPADKASIVIAFDLSISKRTDNPNDFKSAMDITRWYISYLATDGQTEVALISLSSIPSVEMDFTIPNNVSVAMNNFSVKTYGNIYKGITAANTGALSVLDDANNANKSILLVTQGIITSNDAELIIAKANQNNVKINILYVSDVVPKNIKLIADRTGGYCINKQAIDEIGTPIFSTMAKISEGYTPYTFTADSYINCDGKHNFELNTNGYGTANFTAEIENIRLTKIDVNPNSLEFPFIKPNTTSDKKDAVIYARNSGVLINDIKLDNSLFKIISGRPDNFPYYLNKDDSLVLSITYSPLDSSISFTRLIVISDACDYDTLFITGGYPNVPPHTPTIKIINPKCGDVLVIGDTIDIKWSGVLPDDIVSIFTEKTGSPKDTIAKNVNGLKHQYIIKDNGKEDSVIFIINQMWPNNIGRTFDFKHNGPVASAFWNNAQDKIITVTDSTENGHLVTIWNANTRDKIYTFPPFNKKVTWAVYSPNPNPNSSEDKYIGVSSCDGYAYIFNTNDSSIYWKHPASHSEVMSIEFSSDCKYAVIALNNGVFEVLDLENQKIITRKNIGDMTCRFVTFHPTKKYEIMAVSNYRGIIRFFDLEGNTLDVIDVGKQLNFQVITAGYISYNHDGSLILLTNMNNDNGRADIINRNTGMFLYSLSHNFSPDQTNLINHASFYHKGDPNDNTLNEDCIITAGGDRVLRRWNMDGSQTYEDSIFIEHKLPVTTGVLDKDGWRLLSASDDSTAKIWNLNQKTLQSYATCKFRIGYAKAKIEDTLYFGSIFKNEMILKTFNDAFYNSSDFPYNIRLINIVNDADNSGHPGDFERIDGYDFPMKINGMKYVPFNIIFKPSETGIRKARLQIIIPNDTLYIVLIGVGLNIGLQPLTEIIDLKNVFIDDYKDTLLPIAVNVSNANISIENTEFIGPQKANYKLLKFITNNIDKSLEPNDTLFAEIRFFPLTIGKKNAVLYIEHSYHNYPLCFNLVGRGVQIIVDTVQLGMNDFTASIGQVIDCPIILNTLTNNNTSDIDEVIFSLVFNPTLIYPISNSNEVKILNIDSLGNGIIDIAIPYKPRRQQIDGLQFTALFGNDTITNIQIINSESYTNSRYYIASSIATFTLIDNCNAGGTRLFDENGTLSLKQNFPNPAINETEIEFEILENGFTSLDLYDITGRHIKNIFTEYKQKGSYSITFDTRNLITGWYYYILENARQQKKQIMLVE